MTRSSTRIRTTITVTLLAVPTSILVSAGTAHAASASACPTATPPAVTGYISNPGELQWFMEQGFDEPIDMPDPTLYNGVLYDGDWQLTSDINMGDCLWDNKVIGPTSNHSFRGTFDGGGHTINGLTITVTDPRLYAGLFGYVSGVDNGVPDRAVITGVHFTGNVTGLSEVGGLIGLGDLVDVLDSSALGDVTATGDTVGGLVGRLEGTLGLSTVQNSSATGNVNSDGNYDIGGLIGVGYWVAISDSFSSGSVTAPNAREVGGLVGYLAPGDDRSVIERSYSSGDVSAVDYIGGLVGYLNGSDITDSYALGSVTYSSPARDGAGGLVGYSYDGPVTDSYSVGLVSGHDFAHVGGLMGEATGDVGPSPVTDSFWDSETSGQIERTPDFGVPKTTTEMQDIATFSPVWSIAAGFDPARTWGICAAFNNGYPFLTSLHSTDPCTASLGIRTTKPPSMAQAIPRPSAGSCEGIDDSSYAYGTGLSGGWSSSWQSWVPNAHGERVGGWVCSRVLEYHMGQRQWQIVSG